MFMLQMSFNFDADELTSSTEQQWQIQLPAKKYSKFAK